MKKILVALILGLSTFSVTAQKELTLEDAVMNQYRAYYPERSVMVTWIPNTSNYSFLSSDYQILKKGNIKNDKSVDLITAAKVSELTGEQIRWMNVLSWKNSNEFYIKGGEHYFSINISAKSSTKLTSVPKTGASEDFNASSNQTAYTIDNFVVAPICCRWTSNRLELLRNYVW